MRDFFGGRRECFANLLVSPVAVDLSSDNSRFHLTDFDVAHPAVRPLVLPTAHAAGVANGADRRVLGCDFHRHPHHPGPAGSVERVSLV